MRSTRFILIHRHLHSVKNILKQHPSWKTVKTENTAGAAKKIHEEQR